MVFLNLGDYKSNRFKFLKMYYVFLNCFRQEKKFIIIFVISELIIKYKVRGQN